MSESLFQLALFDPKYDRSLFDCGSEPLNRYFREQLTQDIRRRVSACFVALDKNEHVAGYYTLASASVFLKDLPIDIIKKLPRYPTVPAVRMGRLAVDKKFRGQGLGSAILADALDRSLRSEIASFALIVDAKNEAAVNFYKKHSFIPFPDSSMTLFLPISTIAAFRNG